MPKVFIPNRSIHDFSPAEPFGELVYLSTGNMNCFQTSRAYRKFWPLMKDSDPEDYLLVTGLPMLSLVAAYILIMKHRRLNLLLFRTDSAGGKKYLERILIGGDYE